MISPILLNTTFRPVSTITANSVSKAILRAALDEFLRRHDDVLNQDLYYFSSYEFVTGFFVDPFREDNRHLVPFVSGKIVAFFAEHYCESTFSTQGDPDPLRSLLGEVVLDRVMRHSEIVSENDRTHELLVRISELEEDVVNFNRICEQRQIVIDGLKFAADERLALVEMLHKVAEERLQVIHRMGASGGVKT